MNILFLCVGNSGRSQIAEGLAKDMLPKSYDIRSAGSKPAKNVHNDAIFVMNEIGIDISSYKTKSIEKMPYPGSRRERRICTMTKNRPVASS